MPGKETTHYMECVLGSLKSRRCRHLAIWVLTDEEKCNKNPKTYKNRERFLSQTKHIKRQKHVLRKKKKKEK